MSLPTYPEWHLTRGNVTLDSEPVTLAVAKAHLRVSSNSQDTIIASLLTAAREACEHDTNRALVDGDFTLKLAGFPSYAIVLPIGVANVANVSIQYVDSAGDTQTLDANTYTVLQRQNDYPEIVPVYGTSFPATRCQDDAVTVRFESGPQSVAESLKSSIKLQIAFLFEQREPTQPETTAIEALRAPYRLFWIG
jgi:uncharacterized phiE125 gp8 family phage protein